LRQPGASAHEHANGLRRELGKVGLANQARQMEPFVGASGSGRGRALPSILVASEAAPPSSRLRSGSAWPTLAKVSDWFGGAAD
jgi:hypothetical protein